MALKIIEVKDISEKEYKILTINPKTKNDYVLNAKFKYDKKWKEWYWVGKGDVVEAELKEILKIVKDLNNQKVK